MTLPRSLTLVAPAASMHSAMNVSSSASLNGCGKIGLEHFDLGFFFGDEIGAAAVAKLSQRVFALLDHALDDRLNARIIERPARIDLALLDACEGHAEARSNAPCRRFHRGLHVFR